MHGDAHIEAITYNFKKFTQMFPGFQKHKCKSKIEHEQIYEFETKKRFSIHWPNNKGVASKSNLNDILP
jgi:hypothetical protein